MKTLNDSLPSQNHTSVFTKPQVTLRFSFSLSFCIIGAIAAISLLLFYLKERRSVSNLLLRALLIMQIVILAGFWPAMIFVVFLVDINPPKPAVCYTVLFINNGLQIAEVWMELMLALNRVSAILMPVAFRDFSTKRYAFGMIVTSICIALGVQLPSAAESIDGKWIQPARACVITFSHALNSVMGSAMITPLLLAISIYAALLVKLYCHQRRRTTPDVDVRRSHSQPVLNAESKRYQMVKSFFLVSLIHTSLIMWDFIGFTSELDTTYPYFTLVSRPLMVLGYAICPVSRLNPLLESTDPVIPLLYSI